MKISQIKKLRFYERALKLIAIGNKGVHLTLIENERKGLPNVFSMDKKIFYRMPDGTISTKSPFKNRKK